jgi:tetratricopeptide (TPR) repeat protein
MPDRQQTLRNTIEWSYDLLDLPAQRLLARLAVFREGGAINQVEAVCAPYGKSATDLLNALDMLVNQSLLRQEQPDGEPRFAMLETIREFAWERLQESGEVSEIERRHAHAYLELAEEAASHVLTWDQPLWLDWLERDHDNLRAAISWMLQNRETNLALRLATAMWRFWQTRGHLEEGADLLVRVLDLPGGDPRNRALALEAAGGVAYWRGEMREAADFYQQSLRLMEELDDRVSVANALYNLAFPYFFRDDPDYEAATRLFSQSLTISRKLNDEAGMVKGLYGLGSVAWKVRDWRRAREILEECLRIVRTRDDPFHRGWILYLMGSVEIRTGRSDLARALIEEGIYTFAKLQDVTGILLHLHYFTALAIEDGQFERAVRLVGAAAQLQETSGARLVERASGDLPGLQDIWKHLGSDRVNELLRSGQHMSLEEVVAFATSEYDVHP